MRGERMVWVGWVGMSGNHCVFRSSSGRLVLCCENDRHRAIMVIEISCTCENWFPMQWEVRGWREWVEWVLRHSTSPGNPWIFMGRPVGKPVSRCTHDSKLLDLADPWGSEYNILGQRYLSWVLVVLAIALLSDCLTIITHLGIANAVEIYILYTSPSSSHQTPAWISHHALST